MVYMIHIWFHIYFIFVNLFHKMRIGFLNYILFINYYAYKIVSVTFYTDLDQKQMQFFSGVLFHDFSLAHMQTKKNQFFIGS